ASLNTRDQVAASSSPSRGSSASGLEQYGQPSGQRCVSSARRPKGFDRVAASATLEFQQFLLGQSTEQLAHVGLDALARRIECRGQVFDVRAEGGLAGAAL